MTPGTMTFDLLQRSAPLALAAAPAMCHVDPANGTSCSWYHGPWQYFRLLGLVSTAAVHETMIGDALRAAARTGNCPRVLISGSTDYAMLTLVLDSYQRENAPVDVSIVDLCRTPLHLCEWYAREKGVEIKTHAGDILQFNNSEKFDVIATHAFMGYFDEPGRQALVRHWHNLLRPGGKLITVQRVRANYPEPIARFTPAQAREFRQQVVAETAKHPALSGMATAAMLEKSAALFADNFLSYPIRSRAELSALFTDAGFSFGKLEYHQVNPNAAPTVSGPSIPAQAEFAHVVAIRN